MNTEQPYRYFSTEIYSPTEPGLYVPNPDQVRVPRELTPEQEAQAARELSTPDGCTSRITASEKLEDRARRFVEALNALQAEHGFCIGHGGDGGEIGIALVEDRWFRFELREDEDSSQLAAVPWRFCRGDDGTDYAEHWSPHWPDEPEALCARCGNRTYEKRDWPTF